MREGCESGGEGQLHLVSWVPNHTLAPQRKSAPCDDAGQPPSPPPPLAPAVPAPLAPSKPNWKTVIFGPFVLATVRPPCMLPSTSSDAALPCPATAYSLNLLSCSCCLPQDSVSGTLLWYDDKRTCLDVTSSNSVESSPSCPLWTPPRDSSVWLAVNRKDSFYQLVRPRFFNTFGRSLPTVLLTSTHPTRRPSAGPERHRELSECHGCAGPCWTE